MILFCAAGGAGSNTGGTAAAPSREKEEFLQNLRAAPNDPSFAAILSVWFSDAARKRHAGGEHQCRPSSSTTRRSPLPCWPRILQGMPSGNKKARWVPDLFPGEARGCPCQVQSGVSAASYESGQGSPDALRREFIQLSGGKIIWPPFACAFQITRPLAVSSLNAVPEPRVIGCPSRCERMEGTPAGRPADESRGLLQPDDGQPWERGKVWETRSTKTPPGRAPGTGRWTSRGPRTEGRAESAVRTSAAPVDPPRRPPPLP
jgi:hypothetical protein